MIRVQWQKVRRDLLNEGVRTGLVVSAIAVGIFGFAAVLSAYAILTRELNQAYLATTPASARLRMDEVNDELLAAVRSNPAIAAAEARRTITGRIKSGDAAWKPLRLFVIQDYRSIQIAKLELKKGIWPPGQGEVLIERDAFQVARIRLGDSVIVKIPGVDERTLHVTGSVLDVGQAQSRMEDLVYGYITPDTLAYLGQRNYLDELIIRVSQNDLDEKHIRSVAGDVAKTAANLGRVVRRVDVPTPGEHPHAAIMGVLLLLMSTFGLCILVLSGILVVNLIAALLTSQVREIGVMKAIGATRPQVALIYLSEALVLGISALVVGLPLGILGGRYLSESMAILLNFDLGSLASPLWVPLTASIAGLAVPLISAAVPVWKGSGISVRQALDDFGASSDNFGASALDRFLAGARGLSPAALLVFRNSFRRRTRLVLTLITLAAGGILFLTGLNLRRSFVHSLDRVFAARKFDLSVSLNGLWPLDTVERAILRTPGVRNVESWIVTEAALPGETSRFTVVGLPPKTTMQEMDIVEGRGLREDDADAIVLNTALSASGASMKVGNTLAVQLGTRKVSLHIVGIVRERMSFSTAYVPRDYIDQLNDGGGTVNSLRVVLNQTDADFVNRLKVDIERNLEHEQIRAQVASKSDGRFSFDQHMLMIYVFLVIVSGVIAVIGGLGLMTTMSLNVIERRREIGVMRAIGAAPKLVCVLIVTEGVVIVTLSWTLATLLSWPLSYAIGNLLTKYAMPGGIDFQFAPDGTLIWLAVSTALAAAAAVTPAWRATRLTVREALTHG